MPRLVIAPEARQDLRASRDYIAKDDPKTAQRFVMRLRDMARMLAGAPAIGRARPELAAVSARSWSIAMCFSTAP